MTVYRAAWICPIARPPIPDGWIAVREGRITAVGGAAEAPPSEPRDLGRVVVLPALINAHTHLELSWLRGRVPPSASFVEWVKQLFAVRGLGQPPDDPKVIEAAGQAARELRECGTIGVGDISNSLATIAPIREAGLRGVVFHELLGFNQMTGQLVVDTRGCRQRASGLGGEAVQVSLAPHAPYSVSPELFRAIRDEVDASAVPITTVHLAESESEVDFLRDGSGPWPGILKWVGVSRDGWTPPSMTPVEYLGSLGVLDDRTLVVHAVQLDEHDAHRLADLGCTVVTCPRSNQWVGVGVPPIARFYAAGLKVAIGTDSFASVDDLNLFAELKTIRWLAPGVPASTLLESATRVGAEALGLGGELGTIEVGKRAALISVDLPARHAGHMADAKGQGFARTVEAGALAPPQQIEEYLVSGIAPRLIRWVSE